MIKRTLKAASLILALIMALSVSAMAASYSDTKGHWGEQAINEWSDYGVIQGSNGLFRPNDAITRAELAKILSFTLKLEEKAAKKSVGEPILTLFRRTGVLPIFVCIIACGFLRDGIESWLPTLYSEAFGRGASESILVSVILPIFSIASVTLIKILHKNSLFNNEASGTAVLFFFAVLLCIPLAFFISVNQVWARAVSLVLTALICSAMHGINFLLISCIPGRFARFGRASTVSGITNSFIYIGAAVATYGIALVSDYLGWTVTIIMWIAVALVGVIMTVPAYRRYTAFIKDENCE